MRQQLDIYASVVLCKSLPGVPTRHSDVDFAIIRENTEGEYSGLEHQSYPGVVESLKVSTRAKAERISRFAFDFALRNGRKVGSEHPRCNLSASLLKYRLESDLRAQSKHHEAR
jgi:isocitrate dehydrogenase (NAD+)